LLGHCTIYSIQETDDGIWLSSDNGLFLVDLEKGVLEHIDEKKSHLPNNNILYLHKDADGIYWIASRGGGLIRWERSTNTFKSYTVNEGLSHNVIYAIFEDPFGFLWMPSDYGLMRFEKATGICRTFLRTEGIPHEEFNRTSYYKDSKGNFYFGGLNGFIRFNPADFIKVKSITLPVRLTKFETINENTARCRT
jgi:ligand-binding sensor domain-containing protein